MKNSSPNLAVIFSSAALLALGGCSKPQPKSADTSQATTAETTPATTTPVDYASLKGDAAAGEAAFVQCKICHSLEAGKNGVGPSLNKIIGQKAGDIAGYNFSPAMKASGVTWTEDKLFTYLEKPQALVPGTKMTFAGYPDPQKRADVIAWLKANGG